MSQRLPATRASRAGPRLAVARDTLSEWLRVQARWRLHGLLRRLTSEAYERPRLLKTDDDVLLWARLSDFGGARIFVYGRSEYLLTCLFKMLVRPGDTVVDAGANVGEYTLLAAERVGRSGTVLSFEPSPTTFRLLEASVVENGFENVQLFELALSDVDGEATLYVPESAHSGLASLGQGGAADRGVSVRCGRLDTLLAEHPRRPRIDLLKVDVEGWEAEVLRGAVDTIARHKPFVLFEVNGLTRSTVDVTSPSIDQLRELGYELFAVEEIGERRWRLAIIPAGTDPSSYRDRWQTAEFPPNLLAAHPLAERTERIVSELRAGVEFGRVG